MTPEDELNDLKSAMAAATPAPDAARRAANLAIAQENFARTQETTAQSRQTSVRPEKRGFFRGLFDMINLNYASALTGTTALVAVGFLFLSPAGQDLLQGPQAVLSPQGPAILEVPAEPEIAAEVTTAAPAPVPAPAPATADEPLMQFSPAPLGGGAVTTFADTATGERGNLNGITQQGFGNSGTSAPLGIIGPNNVGVGNSALIIQDGLPIAPPLNTEEFANEDDNPLRVVAEDPVSTFSIDVDTASWSLIRSSINRGQLPPADAVRIEEMVNYFPYDYTAPDADSVSPFLPTVNVFQTPWNPDTQLVRIGIQGELPAIEDRPPLNLVFLIDTSGSMNGPAKLPLLIQSFRLLLDRLQPEDEVAIVTYAGSAGVALEPTAASDTAAINAALTALQAGGSTNGVGGLEEAYRIAAEMTAEGEVSRVLLATDGDFNVGLSDPSALEDYISDQRDTGIYLSVLGFGRGNLQDDTMQTLAQNGNGTAAFIDTLHEAQRVLVDQFAGALFTIADDLKVQVEFNPEVIAEYRLIGYETRALNREDFANDAVDAGELGAGHSVTAIYEVTPVGSPATLVAPLRYAADDAEAPEAAFANELGFLSLRWKEPGEEDSQLVDVAIPATSGEADSDAAFAAAIAGFGQLLRDGDFLGDWTYGDAIALAVENRGADEFGYRAEAIQLMRLAETLAGQ